MPSGTTRLRGRGVELARLGDCVAEARDGHGSVLLIESAAGFGKTSLLAEACVMARRAGARTGSGRAAPAGQALAFAPLMEALFEGTPPLFDAQLIADIRTSPEVSYWLVQELEALLERAALDTPLLICLDDLQWSDPSTLAALRPLTTRLASLPIAWVCAYRSGEAPADVRVTASRLVNGGAQRLRLPPLGEDAIATVVSDLMGAAPGHKLLQMAARAGGNPFLLVELMRGLLEEGSVDASSGRVELVTNRLPARVRDSMRTRLDGMPATTRHLASVATVLGQSFTFNDLAKMFDVSPATLLEPVDELLAADILVAEGDRIAFRHDIVREAVLETVPEAVVRALHRRAVDVMLAGGAAPLEVASALAASAEPGDGAAVATLLKAMRALAASDPGGAATLGRRALELSANDDPLRTPLVAEVAMLLHAADQVEVGRAFAETALREVLQPEEEAAVRLTIAGMLALSPDVRAESGRTALALDGISEYMRGRHLARLAFNLQASGRPAQAATVLAATRSSRAVSSDETVRFTLELVEAGLDYNFGRFKPALENLEAAIGRGPAAEERVRARHASHWRCEMLTVLDHFDRALDLTATYLAVAQADRQQWEVRLWELSRGRQLFQVGRLADSAALLEGLFGVDDGGAPIPNGADGGGLVALGRSYLHLGDTARGQRCAEIALVAREGATPTIRRHMSWLLTLLALADGDHDTARSHLASVDDIAAEGRLPTFWLDVTDPPQLVRIALLLGDTDLTRHALLLAQERARLNPGVASIVGSARHAAALADGDDVQFDRAISALARSPRPLALASAIEDAGRAAISRDDRRRGIEHLDRALQMYTQLNASWDAARVRGRLRRVGIRRRLSASARPTTGVASLTESEHAVSDLVAHGLTNREVAERLFISPHTVSTHLRHAFAKLGIRSRVELTRTLIAAGDHH
jgi:DNA-binding CsgD family transcriptional regulator/DNA-binding Lrp family transcriptional regulator